jgi:hypothetical protein
MINGEKFQFDCDSPSQVRKVARNLHGIIERTDSKFTMKLYKDHLIVVTDDFYCIKEIKEYFDKFQNENYN